MSSTLVVVCGHAIYHGFNPHLETDWYLAPFQAGEHTTFLKHIEEGIRLLCRRLRSDINSKSVLGHVNAEQASTSSNLHESYADGSTASAFLAFSGGVTSTLSTRSEASSYLAAAKCLLEPRSDLIDHEWSTIHQESARIEDHLVLEPWATDTFQNVLLSLLLWPTWTRMHYKQTTSTGFNDDTTYTFPSSSFWQAPDELIIVSHAFKRPRVMDLHIPVIQSLFHQHHLPFPERVEYVGINPEWTPKQREANEAAERTMGYEPWTRDELGTGDELAGKRRRRGWKAEAFLSWYETMLEVVRVTDTERSKLLGTVASLIGESNSRK